MNQHLAHIAILVDDYDRAIEFYTKKLGFKLIEDTKLSQTKRWVLVKPQNQNMNTCAILLAQASTPHQQNHIGNQSGGRVFLFLHTDDLNRDYENLLKNNIEIIRLPSHETHGKVLVFKDIYGNLWDLIQPNI